MFPNNEHAYNAYDFSSNIYEKEYINNAKAQVIYIRNSSMFN